MARGKRGKRGGGSGGGGGVRRPPPSSPEEESSHYGGGGGGGSSIRSGISNGGRSSNNSSRRAEDPPTTRSAVEPGHQVTTRNNNERARSRDPPLSDNNQGYVRNNHRRPSTSSSAHNKNHYPQRSNNINQRTSYNDEYSIQSSSQQSRRSARRNNSIILNTKEEELYEEYQDQLYNQQFNTNDTQSIQSSHSFTPAFQSIQSTNNNQQQFQQPSFHVAQQLLQQQQIMHPEFEIIPSHQPEVLPSQQQQLQSAAQFNLTPLYNDVEMASLHSSKSNGTSKSKKKKMKGKNRQSRRDEEYKTIQFEDEVSVLSYNSNPNSGRYTESSSNMSGSRGMGGSSSKKKKNQGGSYYPVDTQGLDFLEQSDSDEEESEDDYDYPEDEAFVNEDKRRGGSRSSRNHEEFYNYDNDETEDDDDESSYDDDEERPFSSSSSRLRRNKNRYKVLPKQSPSIISRSEQCLNRTLVLLFVTMCFIFIRNHTPWWKEHVRRVNLSKHHHHNILAGTDDDDQTNVVDPMAVYNTNDDDSTHTRDHDPTHKYDEITNHVDGAVHTKNNEAEEKREEVTVEVNPDSKYFQSKPGERVSNRPAEKSIHHGFNDEEYSDRPQAKVSASEYTEAISRGEVPPPPQRDFIYEKPPEAEGGDITSMHTIPGDVSRYENVVRSESIEVAPSMQQQQKQEEEVSSLAVVPPPPLPMQQQQQESVPEEQQEFFANPEVQQELQNISPPLIEQQHQIVAAPEAQNEMSASNPSDDDGLGGDLVEWGTSNDHFNDVFNGESPPPSQQVLSSSGNINDDARVDEQVKNMGWDGSNGSSGGGEPGNSQMVSNLIEQESSTTQEENVSSPPPEESKQPLMPIMSQAPMSGDQIKAVYEDSFNRWNHPFDESKDVPVFWRIPRSASGTVESVLSYCYRMVLANSMGTANGHDQDTKLDVVQLGTGAMYVNVDMATPTGIQHAKDMNLGSSDMVNAVVTPFIFETAANIFKDTSKSGKCFTLLRHPVDRAVSLYHHYQIDESGNPNTAQYKGMSIDEYADNVAENNWLVRFLTNKRGGNLTWQDLEAAKDVFGKKCLIGLVDRIDESLSRYEHFFGWDKKISDSDRKDKCVRQYLDSGDRRQEHPTYEGTTAWETLRKKNEYDEILYEYAKNLYEQQSSIYEKTT